MLPFKLTTFSETYSNYLEYYKYHYGQSKIDEVKRKIQNSNTVKKLFEESRIRRGVLTGKDYVIAMNSITYFMFSKKETIILGALIALRLWNETINSFYYLASEDRLAQITYKIFRNAGIDIGDYSGSVFISPKLLLVSSVEVIEFDIDESEIE